MRALNRLAEASREFRAQVYVAIHSHVEGRVQDFSFDVLFPERVPTHLDTDEAQAARVQRFMQALEAEPNFPRPSDPEVAG